MFFMPLLEELRRAVKRDERSQAAIAESAGIHVKTFYTFMAGRRGLSVETMEKLAKALKLEIIVKRKG